jgi:hypothetical protein
MTEPVLCGYCVDLPEQSRASAAELSRCSLCGAELGITVAGKRFRIDEGALPRRRRWSLLVAPALAGTVACMLLVGWLSGRPDNSAPKFPRPMPPMPPVGLMAPGLQPPPEAPGVPGTAAAKPIGEPGGAPQARAKPAGIYDAVPERLEAGIVLDSDDKIAGELPAPGSLFGDHEMRRMPLMHPTDGVETW